MSVLFVSDCDDSQLLTHLCKHLFFFFYILYSIKYTNIVHAAMRFCKLLLYFTLKYNWDKCLLVCVTNDPAALWRSCQCCVVAPKRMSKQRRGKVIVLVLFMFSHCVAWLFIELCSETVDFCLSNHGTKRWPVNSLYCHRKSGWQRWC